MNEMSTTAWAAALALSATGLVLTIALPPDPWPYVGAAMVAAAPVLALAALIRAPRWKAAVVVVALTLVPVAVLVAALYVVASASS